MTAKLILIAGVPGSGKSTCGEELQKEIRAAGYVDDYHRDSVDNTHAFEKDRDYDRLIEGLQQGQTWIASDIMWCRQRMRETIEEELRKRLPNLEVEWRFVVTAAETCRRRVKERDRPQVKEELRMIDELSRDYHIPAGAKIVDGGGTPPCRDPHSS